MKGPVRKSWQDLRLRRSESICRFSSKVKAEILTFDANFFSRCACFLMHFCLSPDRFAIDTQPATMRVGKRPTNYWAWTANHWIVFQSSIFQRKPKSFCSSDINLSKTTKYRFYSLFPRLPGVFHHLLCSSACYAHWRGYVWANLFLILPDIWKELG